MAADERELGRVLVIANPAAQNGRCAEAAAFIERFLRYRGANVDDYELALTTGPGSAERYAEHARGYDTLLVVGGDGVIHDTVNGLMNRRTRDARPVLAIVPMGSGNDYARMLGLARNDPERALAQIVHGTRAFLDLGRVNGRWFCETCSFGLDAAIAFDTMERRKRTKAIGTLLFAQSGISVFMSHKEGWRFTGRVFEGGEAQDISGEEIVFACQVGRTYGGGFEVCPEASPEDGLLDLCYTTRFPNKPKTLVLFGLARFGHHTGSREVRLRRFERLEVDFETEPPCQVDGEPLTGFTHFEVESIPHALEVVLPAR